jgi:AcrR family transcriptional regulator
MARLSRAETQELNRAKVLVAAQEEFAERGFRDAKVDTIAERAELTRGAVYSNFPGKRALYFAVLADLAERTVWPAHAQPGHTLRSAVGAFARGWVGRDSSAWLGADLMSEVRSDEGVRRAFSSLLGLDALLLALAMERLAPPESPPGAPPARLVRMAETVLTTLHGARQLAVSAPGFVEPFDVVSACEALAGLVLSDFWVPPSVVPGVQVVDEPWSPPAAVDLVSGGPVELGADGVVVVLGLHRLVSAETAVRVSSSATVVLVTSSPAELIPLTRLVVADVAGCLRQAFPAAAWPLLRVVCDSAGSVAAAVGLSGVSDATEAAVLVEGGRIVARAEGFGAVVSPSARRVG